MTDRYNGKHGTICPMCGAKIGQECQSDFEIFDGYVACSNEAELMGAGTLTDEEAAMLEGGGKTNH